MPFYPTYEEWKPKQLAGKTNEEVALFILPMRNGNYKVSMGDA